ncbi:sugar ABC transporter ATP-binding protein [Brevibacillus massiliensis]|uniref:sugar ABC transporter ATP-binding protein n=1 Tax=Brevibacillus massiliensis TaxID=1118054 RepID=UPI0002F82DCB|nr:sugar ABC transporter ATP-binding protein [Brevibacillus massiliensis]
MDWLLEVQEVEKSFPGVLALQNVWFQLRRGEIHALVGHNGAGKSTFVKVITGTYIPESGRIFLEQEQITLRSERDAITRGIGIVTQEGSLIPNFNAIENIFLGNEQKRMGLIQTRVLEEKAKELMNELGVSLDLHKQVKALNPAQRKLVEIMKVLQLQPKVLILDEPTAALSDKERKLLFMVMNKLKVDGIGIIFITHYLDEVFSMSDRITVFRNGMNVGTRVTHESTQDEIIKLMIDKDHHEEYPVKHHQPGETLLEVKGLSDGEKVISADLTIRRGEIVGIFGTVGAGRTELAELIFGASRKKSGTISIDGKEVKINSVAQAMKNGLALIPDDRLRKALILNDSVKNNLTLSVLKEMSVFGWLLNKKERDKAEQAVRRLNIKTPELSTKISTLSGGNKQKVSFGKRTMSDQHKPRVFIFDEPTEGVDIGARAEMYSIMVSLAEQGAGILLISSDISEILGLSDRIYVMRCGQIVDEVSRDERTHERLIESSLGV